MNEVIITNILYTIQIAIEHLQCASYARTLMPGGWKSGVDDFFQGLEYIRLKIDGTFFIILQIFYIVLSFLLVIWILARVEWFRKISQQKMWIRVIFHNIIFGVLVIPHFSTTNELSFCNKFMKVEIYDSLDCWNDNHSTLFCFAFIASGIYVFSLLFFTLGVTGSIEAKEYLSGIILYNCYYFILSQVLANTMDETLLFTLSMLLLGYQFYVYLHLRKVKVGNATATYAHICRIVSLGGQCWIWMCAVIDGVDERSNTLVGWPLIMILLAIGFGVHGWKKYKAQTASQ